MCSAIPHAAYMVISVLRIRCYSSSSFLFLLHPSFGHQKKAINMNNRRFSAASIDVGRLIWMAGIRIFRFLCAFAPTDEWRHRNSIDSCCFSFISEFFSSCLLPFISLSIGHIFSRCLEYDTQSMCTSTTHSHTHTKRQSYLKLKSKSFILLTLDLHS